MSALERARSILQGSAEGPVIHMAEALSFWGGVDPDTGCVIDVHHPQHGVSLTGAILMMPRAAAPARVRACCSTSC